MEHRTARLRASGCVWLLAALLLAGCTSAGPAATAAGGGRPTSVAPSDATPKRLVVSIQADIRAFNTKVAQGTSAGPVRGGPELEWLLNSALTLVDDHGTLQPQLAEQVPTLENGGWQLNADGTMQTTWTIRQGTQWHDGAPFTSDDLLFTAEVVRDPDLGAAFRDDALDQIDSVEAPNDRTIVVNWKGPLINADQMFSHVLAVPLPRHLLEDSYTNDKARFLFLPYWLDQFVGTGPFKLDSMIQGSSVLLRANDAYVLGRPKIDEIEIRLITDPDAVIAGLLSGTVDLTLGYGLSLEQGISLKNQWSDGTVEVAPNGWIPIFPQLLNPNPPVVADLRFREALMEALDRQEMADTLQDGLVQPADVFLNPSEPDFPAVAGDIVPHPYDPAKAVQQLEDLGYMRDPDGFLTDANGQRLSVDIETTEGLDIQVKSMFAVADAWGRVGVDVQPIVRSLQDSQDRQQSAEFPGFRVIRQPNALTDMKRYLISQAPVAANNYTGMNFARYIDQGYNDLVTRYFVTIPTTDRTDILGQILHQQSGQLVNMGLLYNAQSVAVGNRVQHITNSGVDNFNQTWNAQDWDVTASS